MAVPPMKIAEAGFFLGWFRFFRDCFGPRQASLPAAPSPAAVLWLKTARANGGALRFENPTMIAVGKTRSAARFTGKLAH
jgi:hypothetical protein